MEKTEVGLFLDKTRRNVSMTLVSSLYQILNYHNSISVTQGRSHCGGGQEAIDPLVNF